MRRTRHAWLVLALIIAAPAVAMAAPRAALTPLTAREKQVAKKFRTAMQRGRAATAKKQYPKAIAAFTGALAILPDDPRALGERGYAKLLAGDHAAAEQDLLAAQRRATAATTQGQIAYNLGLIAEARGDRAAAARAFAESNRVRPTKAAAAKLAGKAVCEAQIDRTRVAGITYPGWVAAARGLAKTAQFGDPSAPPPKTPAAARELLCGEDACAAPGPWLVTTADDVEDESYHLVIAAPGGKLLVFADVGTQLAGRCPSTDDVRIVGGSPLHVTVVAMPNDMVYVDIDDDEIRPCEGTACATACFYTGKNEIDLFIDVAAGARILSIDRPATATTKSEYKLDEDFTQPTTLTRTPTGVVLRGGGCDLTVPFSEK